MSGRGDMSNVTLGRIGTICSHPGLSVASCGAVLVPLLSVSCMVVQCLSSSLLSVPCKFSCCMLTLPCPPPCLDSVLQGRPRRLDACGDIGA